MVFQQFHLVPYLTVYENVLAAGLSSKEDLRVDRAEEPLKALGFWGRREHKPSELSVGEKQRCAVSRALLNQPGLVLADEPTGNLDANNGDEVGKALRNYAEEGHGVLVVSYDPRLEKFATRTVKLEAGNIGS